MGAEKWVEATGIPLPTCKMQGCCCRGASPSVPFYQLLAKAASGDGFARDFFSIFIPHSSHQAARELVSGLVEKTLIAAKKDPNFRSENDVVFYHCRFIGQDNRCQIWEDRPALCRAYPDTPFVVFAPGCAFEPWALAVRQKFAHMKDELASLKTQKANLESVLFEGKEYTKIDDAYLPDHNLDQLSMVLSLTSVYLSSPLSSYLA